MVAHLIIKPVRRLERKYGSKIVEETYKKI